MTEIGHFLRPARRRIAPMQLAIAFCAICAALLAMQAWRLAEQNELLERRVTKLKAAQAPRPVRKASRSDADAQKRWAALGQERAFAWPPIFLALERAGADDIELLEFRPDKQSRRMVLSGEAKDQAALSAFLSRLEQQPVFAEIHLTHQQNRQRERLNTVEFEIKGKLVQ